MAYFQLCNIFAKKISRMRIVGLGNALTDVLARLHSDECFDEMGLLKGGMQLIGEEKLLRIMSVFEGLETTLASGGSAANAVSGVARMGIESGFIGKIGRDAYGRFFREDMERNGVQTLLIEGEQASGCAMTMITPDGERTFGTFLGAAATLCAEELSAEMFEGYDILHIEGYLVQDAKIENDMRRDLFEHFQKMSFRYFDNAKTGQLLSRLTSDIAEIGELSFRGPNDVIVCCITMVGTIGILFWMNVYLGILIALLLITKTLHTVYVNKKMKAAFRDNRIKSGEITARAEESLGGIRLVKAFAQEEYELARFMEKSLDFLETRRKSYKILAYFSGSVNFFTNITNLLILACGGLLIAKDKLSLSDFVAFLLYVNLFMKPLLRLTVFTEMYQRGMAGFQRFYEIMEMQPEIIDNKNAIDCVQIRGEIEFDNLVFGYSEQRKVIKGFNLKITPGQTVAFVGETGAGKTTIASLLLRFYEPLSGKILIDGIDIRQYKQQELRRNIGIVQQDVFLFSDSVTHNIAYAKPEAGQKEVEKAARMAAADRFIQELPDKYDTEIGERGVKLSGGQKQRLAIARVF